MNAQPPQIRGPISPIPIEDIAALLPASGAILDVGCGNGELLQYLSRAGQYDLYGVEPNEARAAAASALCPAATIVQTRAEALPFADGSFDAAVLSCVFSLCQPAQTAEALYRALRPGGTAVVADLYARHAAPRASGSPMVRNLYAPDTLEGFFQYRFRLSKFEDRTAPLAAWAAQRVFDGSLPTCVSDGDYALLRQARPGYGIWLWTKR